MAISTSLRALIAHVMRERFCAGAMRASLCRFVTTPEEAIDCRNRLGRLRGLEREISALPAAINASAPHTQTNVIASTRVNGSPKPNVANSSVIEGERYCRKPERRQADAPRAGRERRQRNGCQRSTEDQQ